jgi:hypothetical protein
LNTKKKPTSDISAANKGRNVGKQGKRGLFE